MRPAAWISCALLLLAPPAASAWSGTGHQLICELAFQQLTPEAKSLVSELRRVDPDPSGTFRESCTWADEVRDTTHRDTYEYHFLDLRNPGKGLDIERDCAAKDCITVAIQRYSAYLRSYAEERRAGRPVGEREAQRAAEALKFLGHFVGDIHQPLHIGRAADQGGNTIEVVWGPTGETRKLHSVWDANLLSRSVGSAGELVRELKTRPVAQWRTLSPATWARETWTVARDVAYRVPAGNRITNEYIEKARPAVEEQVLKASVRLAHLLNEAAKGE